MANPLNNLPSELTPAAEWMQWHKDLLAYMPLKDANEVWTAYWTARGKNKDDYALRTYMKQFNIDLTSNIIERAANVGHGVGNFAGGVLHGIGNIFGVGKWVVLGVGGVILISVLGAVVKILANPIKSADVASRFTPAGQGASAIKK